MPPPHPRVKYHHKLVEEFFCRDLSLLPHLFTYLVICSYWYRLTPCILKSVPCVDEKIHIYCLALNHDPNLFCLGLTSVTYSTCQLSRSVARSVLHMCHSGQLWRINNCICYTNAQRKTQKEVFGRPMLPQEHQATSLCLCE